MMRGGKSVLGLLVVLLALGAYLYFVESKRPADDGDRKEKVFSSLDAGSIDQLVITSESGDTTTLHKTGSDWEIVEPVKTKSDASQVSGITTTLASLEVQRVIDDNPPDLEEYGLAKPRVRIEFKAGGQDHTLLLGRKTPPATDYYAKLADQPRVFLISSYLDSTFNRSTFDLRDKTAVAVNRDEIDSLTVNAGGKTMRFAKSGGDWRIAEPIEARGDFSAIDGLVNRISSLQMTSVVAESGKPSEYGLDKPAATVTIGNKSSHATLDLGTSAGDKGVYARDESRPIVFTVESSLLDDLRKDPSDYRVKDLFDARAFNTTHVEIAHGGQTWTFDKSTRKNKDGQDEEVWHESSPRQKDITADQIGDLLAKITSFRAESFASAAPARALDAPDLTITLKSDDGKRTETARVGKAGTDAWAQRDGEPGAARVAASTVDEIVKALEELK
jgi:hypothetical protein